MSETIGSMTSSPSLAHSTHHTTHHIENKIGTGGMNGSNGTTLSTGGGGGNSNSSLPQDDLCKRLSQLKTLLYGDGENLEVDEEKTIEVSRRIQEVFVSSFVVFSLEFVFLFFS
jgi:hypothetical protein